MSLPASFIRDGFQPQSKIRGRLRRLLLSLDGPPGSGKTEFALSAPGPGICICLDRGFDAMLDNPTPPSTRQEDYAFKVIAAPGATQALKETFKEYWDGFYKEYRTAVNNTDARTVIIDGDSDSWELQRLAEWGKLAGVGKGLAYTGVNAARRAMYNRAWDSGKIVIATNKIKKNFKPVLKADGTYLLDSSGKPERDWDGTSYEEQGFDDQGYVWQVKASCLYNKDQGWGVRIVRAKANPSLEGLELWGDDCNFASLVQAIYPQVGLEEWGF